MIRCLQKFWEFVLMLKRTRKVFLLIEFFGLNNYKKFQAEKPSIFQAQIFAQYFL
jgi:hypothetical protein